MANTISEPNDRPRIWEEFSNKSKNEKIRLFILEDELVTKNGWKTILSNNIHSKKYKLSMKNLDSINWQIVYR